MYRYLYKLLTYHSTRHVWEISKVEIDCKRDNTRILRFFSQYRKYTFNVEMYRGHQFMDIFPKTFCNVHITYLILDPIAYKTYFRKKKYFCIIFQQSYGLLARFLKRKIWFCVKRVEGNLKSIETVPSIYIYYFYFFKSYDRQKYVNTVLFIYTQD